MLRSKGNSYKRKRQEINDMTAELQLLKRTEEILKEQVDKMKSRMVRKYLSFILFFLDLLSNLGYGRT
jgi:cell division protein FtsB